MQKFLTLLLFVFLYNNQVQAQKANPPIPVSPNAAAIGKFNDVDVSPYVGQTNPTIKLFDIQFNDYSFPIQLDFSSGGLKVQDIPSSTGMGTTLNATKVISRQTRGVPDEQTHGFNGYQPTALIIKSINAGGYSPTTVYSSITKDRFKRLVGDQVYDGEPDMFTFGIAEGSGRFFFDENQTGSSIKQATIIPKQPLTIVAEFNYSASGHIFNPSNNSGVITKFTITTLSGIKYIFEKHEGSGVPDDDYSNGKSIVNAWYLTKVTTPNSNQLDFTYTDRVIDMPITVSEDRHLFEAPLFGYSHDYSIRKNFQYPTITETNLSEILINNGDWGKINFTEETDGRSDWVFLPQKPKALKEISLTDGNDNFVKKFSFTYAESSNRLLLKELKEVGIGGTSNEPYKFDYIDESSIPLLPNANDNTIFKEDHWGFYNNNSTGSLLPNVQFTSLSAAAGISAPLTVSGKNAEALLDSIKTGKSNKNFIQKISTKTGKKINSPTIAQLSFPILGTNRLPDFSQSRIGQLAKITYPTKGFTEFEYEANTYYGVPQGDFNPCSGTYENIASITDSSNCGSSASQTFSVNSGSYSCIKINYSYSLKPNPSGGNTDIIFADFLIKDANNAIVFQHYFEDNPTNGVINGGSFVYQLFNAGTYTMSLNVCMEAYNSSNTSTATLSVDGIPNATDGGYQNFTAGGVRIQSVKECVNSNGINCKYKEFSYASETTPAQSSGRLVNKAKYSNQGQYQSVHMNNGTYETEPVLVLNSASQLPLATSLGGVIGYNNVVVKEYILNGFTKEYKGKTVYNYKSPVDIIDENSNTYPYTSVLYDWKRGVIESMKIFDNADTELRGEDSFYSLKTDQNYTNNIALKSGRFIYNPNGTEEESQLFSFNSYNQISGFQYKDSGAEKTKFKVGTAVTTLSSTTNNYLYNGTNPMQMTEMNSQNSKGEMVSTTYKYPTDITAGSLLASANLLISKGKRDEVLETITTNGTTQTSKTVSYFADFGGKAQLSEQISYVGNSTTPSKIEYFTDYDSKGNLKEYRTEDGPTNTLLWAYNGQYPAISIINGSTTSSVFSVTDSATINTDANTLRASLPNALITSYNFKPYVGMIKQTAPNGLKTTYSYDGLARLSQVFDHSDKLIKAYDYLLGDGVNRVVEYTPLIEGTSLGANATDKITKIQYLDNRGKPSQTVHYLAAPDATNSIITDAVQYDAFQRVTKSYIPFSANVNSSTPAAMPSTVNGDSRPYSENITYDTSPLNRLYEVRGVGDAWATKKSSVYEEAAGGLRKYTVASNGATAKSVADVSLTYGANTLIKKTTTDEQGNKTITYTDKDGQVLQKEQELNATETAKTAYIFNDIGQLCYVVQPMGFANAEKFIESDAVFTNFIFAYKYDAQGRQTASHVPGGGWTNFVFDTKDRKVMEQNALQASLSRWTYFKYDVFDRLVETGETANASTQASLQTAFNGVSAGVYPASVAILASEQKMINTYDSQLANSFIEAGKYHDHYTNYKGILASTLARNIDNTGFDINRNYFDNKGRVIQSQNTHHLSASPDILQIGYDFANNKANQTIIHKKTGEADLTENLVSSYDHMNRLTKITHQLNSLPVTTMAEFTYNVLGQLSTKLINPGTVSKICGGVIESTTSDLWYKPSTWSSGLVPTASVLAKIMPGHTVYLLNNEIGYAGAIENMGTIDLGQNSTILLDGNTTSSPTSTQLDALQTVDYSYHIRNMLKGINPTLSASEGDIFGYKLEYETAGFYDGNIGKATWQSPENLSSCNMPTRTNTYNYDKASRLLSSTFTSTIPNENFALSGISFDLNGNIKTLKRNGSTSLGSTASYGLIDDLSYDYTDSGNKLNYVNDATTTNVNVGDFRNTNTGTDDYTYWPDGSLKTDKNKGITLIEYDSYLKKISRVEFGTAKWINFKYDGEGTLLQKSNSLAETWNYSDGMVYKGDVPYQIPTTEGRIVNNAGTWAYEYEYRDIMGNLRASYKNDNGVLKIVQLSDYDAFGFEHYRNSIFTGNTPQKYRYQNQLKIDDFDIGWDMFKFRASDNQLGRFFSIDPLASDYTYNSPYNLQENKFGLGIELEGKELENFNSKTKKPSDLKEKVPEKSKSQIQIYSTTVSNSKKSFDEMKEIFAKSPEKLLSNSKAEFHAPENSNGEKTGLKKGNTVEIDLPGPLNNSYVKINKVAETKNKISTTFVTLEGHVEKGVINFSITNNGSNSMTMTIASMSQVDFGVLNLTKIGENFARDKQKASWQEVLNNFDKTTGGKETKRIIK